MNAASTYGKAVFCPSGTYLISAPITLLNGATVFSDGQCNFLIATGFSSGNTQNCVFCNYTGVDSGTFAVTGYNDFGFYNLNFSSQSITGQTQYTTPIELLGTPGTKVERVRLIGITSANVLGGGIYIREANHVLVDGANIYGYRSTHASWGAGIAFQGVQDSTISNSFIHNTNAAGWHAILVDDWTRAPKNVRIIGNDIHDIQENGDTSGSDGITLELNTASLYGSGIEIIGNTITNIPDV